MTKVSVNTTIESPADTVWETIRSFENPERYVPIVKSSTVQRTAESAQRTCTIQFGNQEGKLVEQLDLVDDEHKVLKFTIADAPPPFKGLQTRYQVSALSDGKSEVHISTEFENDQTQVVKSIEGIFKMAANGLKQLHEKKEMK